MQANGTSPKAAESLASRSTLEARTGHRAPAPITRARSVRARPDDNGTNLNAAESLSFTDLRPRAPCLPIGSGPCRLERDPTTTFEGTKAMTANLGKVDRAARALVGVVLIGLLFTLDGGVGWLAALIGVILLATSALHLCPVYRALGMSTREAER